MRTLTICAVLSFFLISCYQELENEDYRINVNEDITQEELVYSTQAVAIFIRKNEKILPFLTERDYKATDVKFGLVRGCKKDGNISLQIPIIRGKLQDTSSLKSFMEDSIRTYLYIVTDPKKEIKKLWLAINQPSPECTHKAKGEIWNKNFTGTKLLFNVNNQQLRKYLYIEGRRCLTRGIDDTIYVLPEVEIWGIDLSTDRGYSGCCLFCNYYLTYNSEIDDMYCSTCFFNAEDYIVGGNFCTSTGSWKNVTGNLPTFEDKKDSYYDRHLCIPHSITNILNFYYKGNNFASSYILYSYADKKGIKLTELLSNINSNGGLYENEVEEILDMLRIFGDISDYELFKDYNQVNGHIDSNNPIIGIFEQSDTVGSRHAVMIIGYDGNGNFRYYDSATGNYHSKTKNNFNNFIYMRRKND